MKKKIMNILFASDSNYAMPLAVSIASVFINNTHRDINVYILYSSLLETQIDLLLKLSKQHNQKIFLIQVNEYYFSTAPTLRWTKETYYRLLLTELLPQNINRVLYLDCDIVVNRPLDNLYDIDLETFYLGMVKVEVDNISLRKRLGLNLNGKYYQAGVILFDLNKSREVLNYTQIIKTTEELGERLQIVDQDIINVIFDGKIKELDKKFNNSEITSFQGLNMKNGDRIKNETYIFHYATGKPWNNLFSGSCEDVWYKYLILSPYQYIYKEKYGKFKYKILRTKLVKILFYKYIKLTPYINNLTKKIMPINIYNKLKEIYRKYIK